MAARAGITVNIINTPSDSYWDDIWLKKPFLSSYWAPRPTASALAIGYRCDTKWPETHWCRKDYDALLDQAQATANDQARQALYAKAQQMLTDEGGAIVVAFASTTAALRKGCEGYDPAVDYNRMDYRRIHCQ